MSRSTHRVVTVEMMAERILVTGSSGFIGAWVVRDLIERRVPFVMLDRDPNLRRLGDLLPELPSGLKVITGDVSDLDVVARAIEENGVTAIIHLAGAQIPICRETPLLGAQINVMGTMAVFEAARQQGTIRQIAYASSAGVMGRVEDYPPGLIPSDAPARPATHYGVFKQCNEGNARVYFQDHGVSSVGLRPGTVYGGGRDFGLTSDPTKAVKAALVGRPFTIRFRGDNAFQYAPDVAATFVLSALEERQAALTFNMRGRVASIAQFVAELEDLLPFSQGLIRFGGDPIPVAVDYNDSELRAFLPSMPNTPLRPGIEETLNGFRRLQQAGKLDLSDLEQ